MPPRAASRVGEAGQRLLERDDRRRRVLPLPLLLRIPLLPTAGRPRDERRGPARDGGASFTPEKVARDGVARFPLARIIVGRRLRRDADQGHGGDGGVLDVRLVLPPRRRADAVAAEREHRRVAREPVESLERSRRARRRLHERPRRPRDAFARFRPLQKHLRRLLERLFGVRALVPVEEGVEVRPRLGLERVRPGPVERPARSKHRQLLERGVHVRLLRGDARGERVGEVRPRARTRRERVRELAATRRRERRRSDQQVAVARERRKRPRRAASARQRTAGHVPRGEARATAKRGAKPREPLARVCASGGGSGRLRRLQKDVHRVAVRSGPGRGDQTRAAPAALAFFAF